jgi:transposase
MTDDELHRRWNAGQSLTTIAERAGVSKHTIGGMVRRLRANEGIERWPYHPPPLKPRTSDRHGPKRLKAGTSTLPPLASLEGHGETPHR